MVPLLRGHIQGRAVLDRQTIHVCDLQGQTDEYPESSNRARSLGFRTALAVPLIPAGEAIGVIIVRRTEVRPFTDRQIDLLKTFADQAVIAIENARLFEEVQSRTRELQQSLDQQTAMSEVLGVIGSSPGELQPVFDVMLAKAVRLCGAKFGNLFLYEEGTHRHVAVHGAPPEFTQLRRRNPVLRPGPNSSLTHLAVENLRKLAETLQCRSLLPCGKADIRRGDAGCWRRYFPVVNRSCRHAGKAACTGCQ
jgi:hypothetical protein